MAFDFKQGKTGCDTKTKVKVKVRKKSVARSSPHRTREFTRFLGLARRGQLVFWML